MLSLSNDPHWYELCDECRIYVVDEANIETHHYYGRLCREPQWTNAFLDRTMRMVETSKNHPSIIMWSLGNESGYGPNHAACAGWIENIDSSRLLPMKVRCVQNSKEIGNQMPDLTVWPQMVCPMYPTIDDIWMG